tara:strand:+ start:765 stop:1244 length:480 start_codon:yes stop_codon:yes gene_type:complete
MRKLLILLFISFNGFTQTYKEVMSIKDIDSFKKVCIENNYELLNAEKLMELFDDEGIAYQEDSLPYQDIIFYRKGNDRMLYQPDTDEFSIQIDRQTILGTGVYDYLLDKVKDDCEYVKIITSENGNEYATYSCAESLFKGNFGFRIDGSHGIIWTFAEE